MKTAFICVCSKERLSQYRVLYQSIKKHVPNVDTILYYGGEDSPTDVGTVVSAKPWLDSSIYKDDWYKYCCIRPQAILDAFSRGYDKVVLLGSDTEFFDYPLHCLTSLDDHDAFVTMYSHEPYPGDQSLYPNDLQILEVGQINADLIGYTNTPSTIKFLHWLEKTLATNCVVNNKIYLDQGWTSMIFSYVDKVKIIRNLGYNVANYNMHLRSMQLQNNKWIMKDGSPLVLFHYAGFVKGKEETISKHQNRYIAEGDMLQFLRNYGSKL